MRAWKGRGAMGMRKGYSDGSLYCTYSTYKSQTRMGFLERSICISGGSGPGSL